MGRAPCCEKLGLKRGPWTAEEDITLVTHIQNYGHANWRALPKLAGLLRCGKSCRLRWMNYLRPDVKRGNFTEVEEEAIINLHEMLGNRWSAIAARLPGRTDNEIKNVWHTNLKKRLNPAQTVENSKRKKQSNANATVVDSSTSSAELHPRLEESSQFSVSPVQSSSELSSVATTVESNAGSSTVSSSEFIDIDDSFWSEALSMDVTASTTWEGSNVPVSPFGDLDGLFSSTETEDMSFWLRVFMEAGDLQDLPEI